MTKVFLHIGQTKTGTTSVQEFCAINRTWLAGHGVHYPEMAPTEADRKKHGFLLRALQSNAPALDAAQPAWDELHRQIEQVGAPNVLISEEVFWHLSELLPDVPGAIAWIGKQLRRYEVRVILYLRPQASWIEAWFNQIVKTDVTRESQLPFPEFLEKVEQRGLFDYAKLINHWANVFGDSALMVRTFEPARAHPADIIDDMMSALGVPTIEGAERPPNRQLRLSLPACELSGVFNRHHRAKEFKRQFMEALLAADSRGSDRRGLLPPEKSLALMQRYAESNRTVAQRYLARETLFAEHAPEQDIYGGMSVSDLAGLVVQLYVDQQSRIRQLRQRVSQLESQMAAPARAGDDGKS